MEEKIQIGWFEEEGFRYPIYKNPEDNELFNSLIESGKFGILRIFEKNDKTIFKVVKDSK